MTTTFKISPERKTACIRLGNAQLDYQDQIGVDCPNAEGYVDKNDIFIVAPFKSSCGRFCLDQPDDIKLFSKSGFAALPVSLINEMAASVESAIKVYEKRSKIKPAQGN